MALTIDRTGKAPANRILREAHSINTIGLAAPLYKLTSSVLFFTKSMKIQYLDKNGDLWPLFYGKDYDFSTELHGLLADSHVAVLIRLKNLTLNGTLYFTYQALGGKWRLNQQQMAQHLLENSSEEVEEYRRVVFLPHLYHPKTTNQLTTNSWEELEQAQALSPYGVFLGIETHPVAPHAQSVRERKKRVSEWKSRTHSLVHYGAWGKAFRWVQRLKRVYFPLK